MSTREHLVTAAKALLWERGYAAMSPRDVLRTSGAGQGSLYHHFAGKADLAATAVRACEAEMRAEADAVLRAEKPPLARARDYLTQPRAGLRGCRLGRLVHDPEVVARDALREPVAAYFAYVEDELAAVLSEAQRDGALRPISTRPTCQRVSSRSCRGATCSREPRRTRHRWSGRRAARSRCSTRP